MLLLPAPSLENDVDRMRHVFPGVPLALASALLFGMTPALSKLLLGSIGPLMLAGYCISAPAWVFRMRLA